MTTIAQMNPVQLAAIKGFQTTQNWPGMYKYIADGTSSLPRIGNLVTKYG